MIMNGQPSNQHDCMSSMDIEYGMELYRQLGQLHKPAVAVNYQPIATYNVS